MAKFNPDFKAKYGYDLKRPDTWGEYQQMAEYFQGIDWSGPGRLRRRRANGSRRRLYVLHHGPRHLLLA